MAGLGGHPDLVPTICTYHAYFSCPETDPFSGNYEAVLDPYWIDPMFAASALTPASVSQQVYAARQKGDPTAFLLWHATPGLAEDWDPGRISFLHCVSHYTSRMGRPPCQWDNARARPEHQLSGGDPHCQDSRGGGGGTPRDAAREKPRQ